MSTHAAWTGIIGTRGASLFTSRLAFALLVEIRPAEPLVLAAAAALLTVASLARPC